MSAGKLRFSTYISKNTYNESINRPVDLTFPPAYSLISDLIHNKSSEKLGTFASYFFVFLLLFSLLSQIFIISVPPKSLSFDLYITVTLQKVIVNTIQIQWTLLDFLTPFLSYFFLKTKHCLTCHLLFTFYIFLVFCLSPFSRISSS